MTERQRSYVISTIRSSRTGPELYIKDGVDGRVLRYQPKGIEGNPDFGSKKLKFALFVDGCFWHKCVKCYSEPKTNRKFWAEKIERNVSRDRKTNASLKKNGWKVIRIWEHDVGIKSVKKINKTLERMS
jgi:DNA mismatch endonuclease (patch repair protein)